ncbi:MAG TPA: hypothetical protein VHA52_05040, partial [Candidatus Babeliaceae bacterium]|nr:hypothetical protein [Candidatus Babeliaceae bacterium]
MFIKISSLFIILLSSSIPIIKAQDFDNNIPRIVICSMPNNGAKLLGKTVELILANRTNQILLFLKEMPSDKKLSMLGSRHIFVSYCPAIKENIHIARKNNVKLFFIYRSNIP